MKILHKYHHPNDIVKKSTNECNILIFTLELNKETTKFFNSKFIYYRNQYLDFKQGWKSDHFKWYVNPIDCNESVEVTIVEINHVSKVTWFAIKNRILIPVY